MIHTSLAFIAPSIRTSDELQPGVETLTSGSAPRKIESKIRVLLADDHRVVLEALASLLQRELDLEIVGQVSDGEMACAMAMRMHPDVVLMDVAMPRLSGIEATRRITAMLPGTRVIALSNYDDEILANAMRQAGAKAYLTKAGPSDVLVAVIRGGWPAAD